MIYLLDTDTLIYWMKGNRRISERVMRVGRQHVGASVVTRMELLFGAYHSAVVEKNLSRIQLLADHLSFLPFDEQCEIRYAKEKARLYRAGQPLDDFDIMIAATALTFDLALVTNNEKHFARIAGLRVENWME